MFFNKNIEPSCTYCRFGSAMGNDEYACSKRGIVSGAGTGSCGSFRYEPTKREPESLPKLRTSGFSDEDFAV